MGHHHHHAHGHHHEHGHHDHGTFERLTAAFTIAVSVNLIFVGVEFVYAYLAHSTSLLADASHNFGDTLGIIFSWIATVFLNKKPSERYSYGFKRMTIMVSVINSAVLLLTMLLIFREAIEKWIHPTPMATLDVMVLASIGILVNGGSALLFARGSAADFNLRVTYLHMAYDALLSFAVVIVAVIVHFTQWQWLDPVAGIAIALFILRGAIRLFQESLSLAMDGVPRQVNFSKLAEYLASIEGVTSVHDLHVWGLSTRENALTVHLIMPDRTLADDQRQAIEQHLASEFNIRHITLQIEQKDSTCQQEKTCQI